MHQISSLQIVDLLLDAVCIVQADSSIVFVSAAFERIFGYAPHELVGRRMLDMLHPDDLPATEGQVTSIMEGELQLQFENRYVHKDGHIVHILWTARWLPDRQVRLAVAHDITERKEHELRQAAVYAISEAAYGAQSLESLFAHIHAIVRGLLVATNFSVVLQADADGGLYYAYLENEHAGAPPSMPLCSDVRCAEVVRSGKSLLITPQGQTRAGSTAQERESCPPARYWLGVPLLGERGAIGALVLQSYCDEDKYTASDLELLQFVSTQAATAIERRQMYERLQKMAQFDALTDLPNRMLLMDRLKTALARARRDGTLVSLLFVDLDDFKRVNDSLGHATGDLLLQLVAKRFLNCVRASDTVARLGGDEFVVLLESGRRQGYEQTVARKILAACAEPFEVQGHALYISASIGTAVYPEDGVDAAALLSRADRSMYLAKQEGGNRVQGDASPGPASGPP